MASSLKERRMDAARLLIENGRAWLTLTPEDIERGAKAVEADPHYRAEIARCARMYASTRSPELRKAVREAIALLAGAPKQSAPGGESVTTDSAAAAAEGDG